MWCIFCINFEFDIYLFGYTVAIYLCDVFVYSFILLVHLFVFFRIIKLKEISIWLLIS